MILDQTASGVRFGYERPVNVPLPAIVTLCGSIQDGFSEPYVNVAAQFPDALRVSMDLPAHGLDVRPGEPSGLHGWATRIAAGEDPIRQGYEQLAVVIADLKQRDWCDADRIMVVGFSRGAFIALHAVNNTVPISVVGMMPVTDLAALTEFAALVTHPTVAATKLRSLHYSRESIWLLAGHQDLRVDSARIRALVQTTYANDPGTRVELHSMPSAGHSVPADAFGMAGAWIAQLWGKPNGGR